LFRKLCLALVALALVAAPLKAQQGIQFQPGEIFGNETAAARLGHAASIKSVLDRFNIANGGTSQWSFGQSTTPVSGVRFTISDNVTALPSMTGFTPTLLVGGADTTRGIVAIQTFATGNESSFLGFSTQGTAAVPLSTVAGQNLVEFFGHGLTTLGGTPGWQHNSGGGFVVNATENYTATAQGSTVDIYATPTGGATTQLGLSVGATNSTFTNGVTVGATGAASGTSRGVAIRTATTGAGAGASFQSMDDSFTVTFAVANASSILGTAYDPTMLFYSATNAYRFRGLTAGLLTSSSNGTVSVTAAGQIAGTATNDSASAGKVGSIFSAKFFPALVYRLHQPRRRMSLPSVSQQVIGTFGAMWVSTLQEARQRRCILAGSAPRPTRCRVLFQIRARWLSKASPSPLARHRLCRSAGLG
jgi:hypothetical protein